MRLVAPGCEYSKSPFEDKLNSTPIGRNKSSVTCNALTSFFGHYYSKNLTPGVNTII